MKEQRNQGVSSKSRSLFITTIRISDGLEKEDVMNRKSHGSRKCFSNGRLFRRESFKCSKLLLQLGSGFAAPRRMRERLDHGCERSDDKPPELVEAVANRWAVGSIADSVRAFCLS